MNHPAANRSGAAAITVTGLCKSFGEHIVLDRIDFSVPEGSVFSMLGPNGAGKTTTVEILSTLKRADGGEISVGGFDPGTQPDGVRSVIGVTGQFSAVDELLTGRENLILMGDLHHLPRAETRRRAAELLATFDLEEAGDKIASSYSGGMTRRLDLAMTLVGDPRIIFLDEPTVGLDPRSRRAMWDVIRRLTARGVTIFLTTQYLEEADQLADRIAVLHQGRLVAEGTADQLKRLVPGGYIRLDFGERAEFEAAAGLFGSASQVNGDLTLAIPSDGAVRSVREVIDRLDAAGVEPAGLSVHTPDLDDVFLALTGGHASEKETSR